MLHLERQPGPIIDNGQLLSYNPNSGECLGSVPIFDESAVQTAVNRARAAQQAWAAQPLSVRIARLRFAQEQIVAHTAEIAALVAAEMGKTETDSLIGDVILALTSFQGQLRLAPQVLAPQRLRHRSLHRIKRSTLVREPKGVIAIISPFNFPVLLSLQGIVAALAAGNAVVHKPSEHAPLTALLIQDLFLAAGLPPDLLQTVTGAAQTGQALIRAGVDHISFTGGTATGRAIAREAGERLIPTNLELSGKNAALVLDDAPLPRAAYGVLAYAFGANGQMCASISRLLVHRAVANRFLAQLEAQLAQWQVSTATGPAGSDVCALVNDSPLASIEELVAEAVAQGAELICGGTRAAADVALFPPTILARVTPAMRLFREEAFGPLLCVTTFQDDEEAIALANDSPYGMTASIWTTDNERAWRIARRLQVGTVGINDHLWPFFAAETPWGGIKASGSGRVGGKEGLLTMTYPKVISYDRLNLPREVYWFPRPKWLYPLLLAAVPLLFSRKITTRLKALWTLLRTLTTKPGF